MTRPRPTAAHPRDRSMEFWRARLGALASRGETDGPRVAEARAALSWHRTRAFMVKEMNLSPERAEALLDQHAKRPGVTRSYALQSGMHTTTITRPDRAALENLWRDAGTWTADTWTRLNAAHFGGRLRYHGIVWGLTPHGSRLGHTSNPDGRITLHPALLDPQGEDPWLIKEHTLSELGVRYAEDVLLHEMIHVALFEEGVDHNRGESHHNTDEWCAEIMRITRALGLPPIKAAPVRPRRINGKVVRRALDDHLSRSDIAHWPHSLRPVGYYTSEGRIHVPI